MEKIICSIILSFIAIFALISGVGAAPQSLKVDYSAYVQVLKKFVNKQGRVDYAALKKNRSELDSFIKIVEKTDVELLSPQDKKAFWINAYNAITLNVVRDKYPVKSIRGINFGFVWEKGRRVAQGKYSLGHIEHKILRPQGDPRIHFALNCASMGCPVLPQKPFDPDALDEQLDEETKKFMNNPDKVHLDRENNILYHSEIFDWFKEDFLKVTPDVLSYIKKYMNEEDREYLEGNEVKLKAINYDWGINDQIKE